MGSTVITRVPVTFSVVARISEAPFTRPVTRPSADTEATVPMPLVQVNSRSSSTLLSASRAVAVSCTVSPTVIRVTGAVTVTDVTEAGSWRLPP